MLGLIRDKKTGLEYYTAYNYASTAYYWMGVVVKEHHYYSEKNATLLKKAVKVSPPPGTVVITWLDFFNVPRVTTWNDEDCTWNSKERTDVSLASILTFQTPQYLVRDTTIPEVDLPDSFSFTRERVTHIAVRAFGGKWSVSTPGSAPEILDLAEFNTGAKKYHALT